MDTSKIFSRSVLEKPESKRASRGLTSIDLTKLIRMGWNENPYGMSPKALEAFKKAADRTHFYQDFWCRDLKNAIAGHYGVKTSNLVVSAGSSPLIEMVGQSFINPDDEVIMCPTFAAFIDMAEVRLGKVVEVPLCEDKKYNLDGILEAITPKTKMIVICNPNNPTGAYRSYDELKEFAKKVPENVVILFDEAYIEFATAPDCKSMIPLIEEMKDRPILVMRTFSKYYGMAGARCGYLITSEEIAAGISKIPGSWVPACAQAAATVAINDTEFYEECKKKIVAGINYISEELTKLGCTVYPTQTNFIMFDPHCTPEEVRNYMIEHGLLISTPMMCRVSVGTDEENEKFIGYMKEVLGK